MQNSLLISAAYAWFAGLLVIMIIVTALFGFILFIALRPIKKDELAETSASKKLKRRETEITIKLLNKQNDKQTNEALMNELREVKSAEKLVEELMEEDKTVDTAGTQKPIKQVKKPVKPAPAKPAQAKPVQKPKAVKPAPAKPAQETEAPVKTEQDKPEQQEESSNK